MGRKGILDLIGKALFIQAGAFMAAFSLDRFLVPNRILDGGIVGISIIVSYLAALPLGLLTFAFNIPFMLLGLKLIGRRFLLLTVYAVGSGTLVIDNLRWELGDLDEPERPRRYVRCLLTNLGVPLLKGVEKRMSHEFETEAERRERGHF